MKLIGCRFFFWCVLLLVTKFTRPLTYLPEERLSALFSFDFSQRVVACALVGTHWTPLGTWLATALHLIGRSLIWQILLVEGMAVRSIARPKECHTSKAPVWSSSWSSFGPAVVHQTSERTRWALEFWSELNGSLTMLSRYTEIFQ